LQGVNLHAEDVLREPTFLAEAVKRNLVVFVWGDDLDNKEHMRFFRDAGVDGLIYDRIDTETGGRHNTFVVEKAVRDQLFSTSARSRSPMTLRSSTVSDDLATTHKPKPVYRQ
jgi:hypothetical protein